MDIKPGYKTTEFWISLAANVVALLVIMGIVTPESQADLVEATSRIVEGVFAVITSVTAIIAYIRSRTKVKNEVVAYKRDLAYRRDLLKTQTETA